ncbi:MAG: hypothetical protein O7E49_08915 [Gemmatimonadetes bacterium]|nr:hypothetical protein [Gemmatimonadota bacterium]
MRLNIWLVPIVATVVACSAPKTVPNPSPTTQVWAPAGNDSVAVMLPTPRAFASSQKVKDKYDEKADSTTLSLEVQSHKYTMPKKRPGAIFSFSYHGKASPQVPGTVTLEVRTTEPQVFQGNAGRYTAGDRTVAFPEPAFNSATSNFGTDVIFTFQIPVSDYSRMLVAAEGALTVGGFDIPLGEGEVESMRALGSRMWSGE